MTKALIALLRNRAVRTMITEICVGIAVGVVAALKKKDWNEKRKRILLHMPEGTPDGRSYGPEEEMRPKDKGSTFGEKRKSWNRERSSKRDYM